MNTVLDKEETTNTKNTKIPNLSGRKCIHEISRIFSEKHDGDSEAREKNMKPDGGLSALSVVVKGDVTEKAAPKGRHEKMGKKVSGHVRGPVLGARLASEESWEASVPGADKAKMVGCL